MVGGHELDNIFYPKSVAVLGVSDSRQRVGYNLFESLLQGGFPGSLYPVHPRLETVLGRRVYHSLAEIPEKVDLALLALNERATLAALEECGEKGVKGAVCVAGGYREVGEAGAALEEELRAIARRYGIGLIGPNTLGLINNDADLYATFYPLRLPKGPVSFISQSGGMGLTFMHRAADAGLGLNKWVGVGNRSTFEFADYLAYFGQDPTTKVIGIFLEGTEGAARMVRVAAAIAKPVVVYKVGRGEVTDYASLTHTGTLAGSYRVYRDIFRQFGLYAVESVAQMVAALKALSLAPLPQGNRVGIMTHTAGPSIVAADELLSRGCSLPPLAAATLEAIERLTGPSPPFVLKNPLDVAGLGFAAEAYGQYLELVAQDPGVDLVLAIYCEHKNWRFPSRELVQAKERAGKPIVACYASRDEFLEEERKLLEHHGIPLFGTPEEAAWGAAALVAWAERLRRKAK
ncbi:MAG: CoA-binding protein [Clostridia bacterium]|nr:CoA-binding protein [Clostridia bacterium]